LLLLLLLLLLSPQMPPQLGDSTQEMWQQWRREQ